MTVPKIDDQITFVYTRDLAPSSRFYGETLELPLVLDQGGCHIFRVAPHAYVGVCEREAAPEHPEGVIVTLVTEDVDGWYAELRAKGVAFESAPAANADYGIYHCFLRDPNGYLVEIQRFDDPDWAAGPQPAQRIR